MRLNGPMSTPAPRPVTDTSPGTSLDPGIDVAELTARLIDIESVSGNETRLADAVEALLRSLPHLEVVRDGDALMARTRTGAAERVILAGHLDTVPLPGTAGATGTVPSTRRAGMLHGRGATDMKGGVAVQLALAAAVPVAGRASARGISAALTSAARTRSSSRAKNG